MCDSDDTAQKIRDMVENLKNRQTSLRNLINHYDFDENVLSACEALSYLEKVKFSFQNPENCCNHVENEVECRQHSLLFIFEEIKNEFKNKITNEEKTDIQIVFNDFKHMFEELKKIESIKKVFVNLQKEHESEKMGMTLEKKEKSIAIIIQSRNVKNEEKAIQILCEIHKIAKNTHAVIRFWNPNKLYRLSKKIGTEKNLNTVHSIARNAIRSFKQLARILETRQQMTILECTSNCALVRKYKQFGNEENYDKIDYCLECKRRYSIVK
ncbi:hypothetical protein EDEG_03536 [Edhazardia aedis USNM 41457]|uniref:Uncharacterized protein n=1 Tax=Edhazardia aedis (strain USNM 41457) TaxID=1003232 RepID=J9D2E9_EDHAE|nr:hypothetical protein EDEG_03536 [Edhazardia aedis USNM 41457]|eukprot:EJW02011.1 hypothetical protein EDEG_03536 [Edhazardia aedis USNM 41457]